MEAADLVDDQHVRDPRGRRAEGDRPPGPSRPAQGREPRAARRADRLCGPRAGPRPGWRGASRRSTSSCDPTRSRSSSIGSGWRRRRARSAHGAIGVGAGNGRGHDDGRSHGRRRGRRAVGDPCPRHRGGDRGPRVPDQRLAADHLRLRQDLHVLHRPVQPGAGAQPPVRRRRRRGARTGRRGLSRGHAARAEREFLRARPAARGALRACRCRTLGRPPPRPPRSPRPRGAHPRDRRAAHRRWPTGDPAPALRDLAPVGPVRPA